MAEIVTVVGLNSESGLVRVALVPAACKSCRGGYCTRSPRTLSARLTPEVAAHVEIGCRVRIESSPGSIVRALFRLLVIPLVAAVAVFGVAGRLAPDGGEALHGVAAVAVALGAVGFAVARGSRPADLPIVRGTIDERLDAYPARSCSGLAEAKVSGR
ncbi:MAG: SoxR reducing system RseC family protein [Spirochaetales bacterium]|nr:SoxR reducing system RseC family protein [Spirochaetales bacterium]